MVRAYFQVLHSEAPDRPGVYTSARHNATTVKRGKRSPVTRNRERAARPAACRKALCLRRRRHVAPNSGYDMWSDAGGARAVPSTPVRRARRRRGPVTRAAYASRGRARTLTQCAAGTEGTIFNDTHLPIEK